MEMYWDGFCRIQDMGNGRAWYSTIWLDAFDMPKRWAEKIAELFMAGQVKKACHYIDMAERRR